MACMYHENRVVIHDLETGVQKVIEITRPVKCAASQHLLAITTVNDGLHLFSTDGDLVHIVPEATKASCVVFNPHHTNILAIGYNDGAVHFWDVSTQAYVSMFMQHIREIASIRFANDGRLFLSSRDHTASIVALDDKFKIVSLVKLKGHSNWVFDILPLPISKQCVTGSLDATVRGWDCQTGECLRTLTEHTGAVASLAMHPNGLYFTSGSHDQSAIIWSIETFEALRRITFHFWVQSLVFSESDTLYAGVYGCGVMSCDSLTGEVGPVGIPGTKSCFGLSLSE